MLYLSTVSFAIFPASYFLVSPRKINHTVTSINIYLSPQRPLFTKACPLFQGQCINDSTWLWWVQPLSLQIAEFLLKAILELIVTIWPVLTQMMPYGLAKLDCAEESEEPFKHHTVFHFALEMATGDSLCFCLLIHSWQQQG